VRNLTVDEVAAAVEAALQPLLLLRRDRNRSCSGALIL
jgi:hypothetical protein